MQRRAFELSRITAVVQLAPEAQRTGSDAKSDQLTFRETGLSRRGRQLERTSSVARYLHIGWPLPEAVLSKNRTKNRNME